VTSLLPSGPGSKSRPGARFHDGRRVAPGPAAARYNRGMNTHVRKVGVVAIVDLKGDLVTEDGDEELHEVVNRLLGEGITRILLNLTHVKRMDSGGVGELVTGWKLAHGRGASIKLLRPGDRVKHTLHLSQILPLVEVFEDEHEAVSSFA